LAIRAARSVAVGVDDGFGESLRSLAYPTLSRPASTCFNAPNAVLVPGFIGVVSIGLIFGAVPFVVLWRSQRPPGNALTLCLLSTVAPGAIRSRQ